MKASILETHGDEIVIELVVENKKEKHQINKTLKRKPSNWQRRAWVNFDDSLDDAKVILSIE